jgi:hypothetical protein
LGFGDVEVVTRRTLGADGEREDVLSFEFGCKFGGRDWRRSRFCSTRKKTMLVSTVSGWRERPSERGRFGNDLGVGVVDC